MDNQQQFNSCIGYLRFSDQSGNPCKSTGLLIAPDLVLTVAHNVSMPCNQLNNIGKKYLTVYVPNFFTLQQRRALMDAIDIIKCSGKHQFGVQIINQSPAFGVDYRSFEKGELTEMQESAKNVLFVDFGHFKLNLYAIKFIKNYQKILYQKNLRQVGCNNLHNKMLTFNQINKDLQPMDKEESQLKNEEEQGFFAIVYILISSLGLIYVGSTKQSLPQRLKQHQSDFFSSNQIKKLISQIESGRQMKISTWIKARTSDKTKKIKKLSACKLFQQGNQVKIGALLQKKFTSQQKLLDAEGFYQRKIKKMGKKIVNKNINGRKYTENELANAQETLEVTCICCGTIHEIDKFYLHQSGRQNREMCCRKV